MKAITSTVLLVLLIGALGAVPAAQTLAEQLQKGIYTEDTLKNKEEAARIYRQILAAPTVPAAISTEAQRRLARLLLQGVPPPTSVPAISVRPEGPYGNNSRGFVEGRKYHHVASGITFDLPTGWRSSMTGPSSDNGEIVTLTDANMPPPPGGRRSIQAWMIKESTPVDQLAAKVAGGPAEKVRQRHSGYGIPGMMDSSTYDIPADSLKPTMINGRHAIVAVASYLGLSMEPGRRADGIHPMREYMTWVNGPQSRVFFFSRASVEDLPALRPVFDQIVNSAIVP